MAKQIWVPDSFNADWDDSSKVFDTREDAEAYDREHGNLEALEALYDNVQEVGARFVITHWVAIKAIMEGRDNG